LKADSSIINTILKQLGVKADQTNNRVLITADRKKHWPTRIITNLPVVIGGIKLPVNAIELDRQGELLVLGIDWMKKNKIYPNPVKDVLICFTAVPTTRKT
jgi:hypothetical protein